MAKKNAGSKLKKIVIIGPESTGKSTLCEQLAAHFNTSWVPEYAREYLLSHGKNYTYPDLLRIAQGQLAGEDFQASAVKKNLIFIDTDMNVMKVWSEFVFNRCHHWILNRIAERKYDLYLLCNTDLPWEQDELREYPDLVSRVKLYHIYRDILINQHVPWQEIKGVQEERLTSAIKAVNRLQIY